MIAWADPTDDGEIGVRVRWVVDNGPATPRWSSSITVLPRQGTGWEDEDTRPLTFRLPEPDPPPMNRHDRRRAAKMARRGR